MQLWLVIGFYNFSLSRQIEACVEISVKAKRWNMEQFKKSLSI